jgi:hypothetical protein
MLVDRAGWRLARPWVCDFVTWTDVRTVLLQGPVTFTHDKAEMNSYVCLGGCRKTVTEILVFRKTWWFITCSTTARHWTRSWASFIHPSLLFWQPISIISISILSLHLLQVYHINNMHPFLYYLILAIYSANRGHYSTNSMLPVYFVNVRINRCPQLLPCLFLLTLE